MNKEKFIMNKTRFAAILITLMLAAAFTLTACGEKPVDKIEVTTSPTKMEYLLNETFSVEGGILTVTYESGSTKTVPLTDAKVTIATEPDMSKVGKKTITVRYGGKSTNFTIVVSAESFTVTFDLGNTTQTQKLEKGQIIERPEDDPERAGYFFDDWYADAQMTVFFEFGKPIAADTTVYARLLEEGQWMRFYFDYDQPWLKRPEVRQFVKNGEQAVRLTVDPARVGYKFDGWYTADIGGSLYSFSTPVATDGTRVYARWTRVATDPTFIFEAEHIDVTGMRGPSWSGTVSGISIIISEPGYGASNGKFLGYLYESSDWTIVTFKIVSDIDATGVTLALRLSMEAMGTRTSWTMTSSDYEVAVNGSPLTYNAIEFNNIPPSGGDGTFNALQFQDYQISANVSLNKGINTITLTTTNTTATTGTTFTAVAPLVDCLKLTSNQAVFTWSDFYNLPQNT